LELLEFAIADATKITGTLALEIVYIPFPKKFGYCRRGAIGSCGKFCAALPFPF